MWRGKDGVDGGGSGSYLRQRASARSDERASPETAADYKDPNLKGKRNGKADIVRVKGRTVENDWGEEGCTFRNAVEIASMYNFTNRISLACGMFPSEEYHALAR